MARRDDDGPSVGDSRPVSPPDRVADELYALLPEDFVPRRDELARAARAAGARDVARAVSALRRPTHSAWALNALVREERAAVEELLDLGAALREAERTLSPDALRQLSAQRNAVVAALVATAADIASRAGVVLSSAATGEVQATLLAALAVAEVADAVRAGRLVRPVAYAGFGSPGAATTDAGTTDAGTTDGRTTGARTPAGPPLRVVRAAATRRREEAAKAVRQAEDRLAAAEAERDRRGAELAAAEQQRAAVAERLEQVREQVRDLERRVADTTLELRTAAQRHSVAEQALAAAAADLRRAREAAR